jgi:hypothetical protein
MSVLGTGTERKEMVDYYRQTRATKWLYVPKKPTPEGIAAEMRDASQLMGPSRKAKPELMVKRQLPKDTKAIVRIPAKNST